MALRKELTATSTSEDNRRSVKINSDVENAKPSSISEAAYQRLLGETTLRAAAAAAATRTKD